jgi:hypothetical protein
VNHHLPDALAETLSLHLDLGKSRLETLAWLIIGVLVARTVNLSHLASQCDSAAQVDSSYRRLQRFFQFVTLEGDWLALAVVKLLKLKGPWVLCLDRTNWKIGRRDVNILMLAIATRRFRIPLMWQILEKGGSSNQGERIRLLERYLALFGVGSITWLLADREFIGGRWLKFLMKNKIFFAVRVKENSLVQFQNGRCHQLKSLLRRPFGFRLLHNQPARFQAMDSALGFPLSFAAKRLGGGELLIVVSNGNGKRALKVYRRRWQIECLFGDSKTRGLNMEDTRLTQPRKLDTLLVIITLAMAWAYACATAVKGTTTIKLRGHGYRAKSWFRLGFDQLRRWILNQPQRAAEVWKRIWPRRKSTLNFSRVV